MTDKPAPPTRSEWLVAAGLLLVVILIELVRL
jgi:hypothetical protein